MGYAGLPSYPSASAGFQAESAESWELATRCEENWHALAFVLGSVVRSWSQDAAGLAWDGNSVQGRMKLGC